MKPLRTLFFCLISLGSLQGADTQLLSPETQESLRQLRYQNDSEHKVLRYNWLSPLKLNGSYTQSKTAAANGETALTQGYASIAQDVFRSGGIDYQIAYADADYEGKNLSRYSTIGTLNSQLFVALLNYRKYLRSLEQSDLKLKNEEIIIYIKRQLYEAGKADITELNNALMDKSTEQKNHASLRYSIAEQRYTIAKLSDIDPDTFELPAFALIEQATYLNQNTDLQYARTQNRVYGYQYDVTRSSFLPSVALNANAGYADARVNGGIGDYTGNFYSAAAVLTIPFTYTASDSVAQAKAAHLKQLADTALKERETKAAYAQALELIRSYRETVDISRQNLSLYDELIKVTKAGVDAGTKTGYDLQTIQNTKAIEELTIAINEINIQIELAKLHFAADTTKESL